MFAFSQLLLLGCWQGKTGLSLLFPISPMNSDNETFNLVVLLVHQNSKKRPQQVGRSGQKQLFLYREMDF